MIPVLALAAGTLLLYGALVWLANLYSQRSGWQPPAGSEGANPLLRRNLAIAVGAIAVLGSAVGSSLWVDEWPAQLLITGQAVLLAAAGASDLRRFHLPLPLTLAGIAIALFTVTQTHMPALYFAFSLGWALVVIVLHAVLSKGSMQLGDHIATIWIALALPFNGLLAVLTGDLANVVIARMRSLSGKKVAAAGAWLVVAAALIGVPPYYAWFSASAQVGAAAPSRVMTVATRALIANQAQLPAPPDPEAAQRQAQIKSVLRIITDRASQYTAMVALEDSRASRMRAAANESGNVAQLAALADHLAHGSSVAMTLNELATALSSYDVDAVRSASQQLAELRQQLTVTQTLDHRYDKGQNTGNLNN
ncbi:MAG: hypothetical protein M1434_12180 [Chloroflexi bacterium]|nr:hypothetical protein [Chloroflexota bacterium]MCL5275480.1 hypothetical protein [Chloroflexota bacterium]